LCRKSSNYKKNRAVHAIRDAIFAGEYSPGERMVEEDLAASLGVSRNVVREAFWQLEAQGLIQSDDYKGKSVAKRFTPACLRFFGRRTRPNRPVHSRAAS
jgi:DNA-binding GntR family transcriptional regulator